MTRCVGRKRRRLPPRCSILRAVRHTLAAFVLSASDSGYHGGMAPTPSQAQSGIGTLNEKPLHAALKGWYARPGDRFEVPVDGYLVDIVRGAARRG